MKPILRGIRNIGKLLGEILIETAKFIFNSIAALFYKCAAKTLSVQQKILGRIMGFRILSGNGKTKRLFSPPYSLERCLGHSLKRSP